MASPAGQTTTAPPGAVTVLRTAAVACAILVGGGASAIFLQYTAVNGLTIFGLISAIFLFMSTIWLAWGALLGLIGLPPMLRRKRLSEGEVQGRTVVLVPVYNEDPTMTFARVAAMHASVAEATPTPIHFAILSDTRDAAIAAAEERWFARLLQETGSEGQIFYRRRAQNTGRKAGNIEEFMHRSGGAYDYALILDADSLMEGTTILEMARRIEADPTLGLLQSLPVVVRAESVFGRAMQFAAGFFSPVFSRGLARLQGTTGPFWGHNAIVRVRAFAACCGLPSLSGPPPFGGHILSHDYVEAALLARGGWVVRLDTDLTGSYEEAPESLVEHAKRDRRWCQGNLQHLRIIGAPGLHAWSRFVFLQGVFAYLSPVIWAGFLISVIADSATHPPPNYFPDPHQFFPVFPSDETAKAIGLAIGIFGLLIMPKLFTTAEAILTRRTRRFGGTGTVLLSVLADFFLLSLMAPVLMAYQTRSVFQVVSGRDGGWPPNRRGDAQLSLGDAWKASRFMVLTGITGIAVAYFLASSLLLWVLPVLLPMTFAPVIIMLTSRRIAPNPAHDPRQRVFSTPEEFRQPRILTLHDQIMARWSQPPPTPQSLPARGLAELADA